MRTLGIILTILLLAGCAGDSVKIQSPQLPSQTRNLNVHAEILAVGVSDGGPLKGHPTILVRAIVRNAGSEPIELKYWTGMYYSLWIAAPREDFVVADWSDMAYKNIYFVDVLRPGDSRTFEFPVTAWREYPFTTGGDLRLGLVLPPFHEGASSSTTPSIKSEIYWSDSIKVPSRTEKPIEHWGRIRTAE